MKFQLKHNHPYLLKLKQSKVKLNVMNILHK